MFCPNCGAKNSSEQKFCRSCGMNLEQTALDLADQFGAVRDVSSQSIDRFFENLGKVAFGGFGTVCSRFMPHERQNFCSEEFLAPQLGQNIGSLVYELASGSKLR